MITLSEGAVKRVKEFIAEQSESYSGIRVSVEAAGCSGFQYVMNLEHNSRTGDEVIQVDGIQVFVDERSMAQLQGTEIDYVQSIEGAGFTFTKLNVTGTCGCVDSFTLQQYKTSSRYSSHRRWSTPDVQLGCCTDGY